MGQLRGAHLPRGSRTEHAYHLQTGLSEGWFCLTNLAALARVSCHDPRVTMCRESLFKGMLTNKATTAPGCWWF